MNILQSMLSIEPDCVVAVIVLKVISFKVVIFIKA